MSLGWSGNDLVSPPEELEEVSGERDVFAESAAPATRSRIKQETTSTSTSTHFRRVAVELVPISSSLWVRDGEHPGEVASPSQGSTETHRTNNHAHSHST
ncbi:hypothetical protein AMECASPLE_028263 [Ameca splendens]|uniref:Uncharacterized protein n=1 Tax=Ameca splendens TaxID=208324 RepID=A0ABV1A0Y6_9TELE